MEKNGSCYLTFEENASGCLHACDRPGLVTGRQTGGDPGLPHTWLMAKFQL